MHEPLFERAFQGDAVAQYEIGDKFYNGDGVPQSHERALAWYRKSAAQGNYWGCFNVAKCYEHGHGVCCDRLEACRWYQKACLIGVPSGWDTDWAAVRLQKISFRALMYQAKAGNSDAQYLLGDAYYNGEGTEQSFSEAFKWYSLSAEQRNYWGCFNMGKCYALGHGTAADRGKAIYWYRLASQEIKLPSGVTTDWAGVKLHGLLSSEQADANSGNSATSSNAEKIAQAVGKLAQEAFWTILSNILFGDLGTENVEDLLED